MLGWWRRIGLLMAIATPAMATATPSDETHCLTCHQASVAQHLRNWDRSAHARAGVTCSSCHTYALPQAGKPNSGNTVSCASCHAAIAAAFGASHHHQRTRGAAVPDCADCHTTAGGNVLPPNRFADSCGRCHTERNERGELVITERAVAVLTALRRVVLARALLLERVDTAERQGRNMSTVRAQLQSLAASNEDLATAWHRFDFDRVDKTSREIVDALTRLNRTLGEER